MSRKLAALALVSCFVLTPAMAQDTEAAVEPARLILTTAGGEELEYTVGDASFYVSTIAGYDDVPDSVDLSLSLSSISPLNEELLQWSSQTQGKSKTAMRSVTIIGSSGEEGAEVVYEITGAEVTSASFSQSSYGTPGVSLSLLAESLTVNGVRMN